MSNERFIQARRAVAAALRNGALHPLPRFTFVALLATAAIYMAGVAVLELLAQPLLRFSLLYSIPVALVTWFVSRRAGLIFAFAAGSVTLVSALVHEGYPPAVAFWNCSMRAGVLTTTVLLLSAVRSHTQQQDQEVRDRAVDLQREIGQRKRAEREFFQLLEKQREQIAYDLHDDLAQVLTAIAMKTKCLESELKASFSPHAESAAAIVKLMNSAVGETREIARGLCPINSQSAELVSAVRRLTDETSKSFGVRCQSTSTHSQLPYSSDAAVHIYRIAQQAIDNAIRHGNAKSIEIKLEHTDEQFRLSIWDDGSGFDEISDTPHGLGLRTMAFRADVFNGTFHISSEPGQGTRVVVTADVAALLGAEPAEHEDGTPSDSRAQS
jgi:signal transduction histidine kinase